MVALDGLRADHLAQIRSVSPRSVLQVESRTAPAVLGECLAASAPVEVLLCDGLPNPWQSDGALRWVQSASVGLDQHLTSPIWADPNVVVTTASGVYGVAISQWVLAVILHFALRLEDLFAFKRTRHWPTQPTLLSRLVAGQTLGILGYGSIGRECARLGRALGMRVLATRFGATSVSSSKPVERFEPHILALRAPLAGPVEILPPSETERVLSESDYLVLAAPLTAETRGLVGRRALERMRPTAILINVSRGEVVDEAALAGALASGGLAGAALDVFAHEPLPTDSPLFDAPNVLLTPHASGAFRELWDLIVELFCANLERYLTGRPLLNVARRERGY
jgi:phosphoglycerate dehydrogenase-like enzyme